MKTYLIISLLVLFVVIMDDSTIYKWASFIILGLAAYKIMKWLLS